MNDESVGIALALTSAAGFATLGVLGILAAREGLSIPTVLALRFSVATVVLWAVLWYRGRFSVPSRRVLALAFGLGAVGYATQSALYFLGLEFLTAGMVAIVLYTYPAFVVGLVAIRNPEKITRPILLALAFAIGGVALITGVDPAGVDPRGVIIVLGAAFAYSLYILVSQRTLTSVGAETLTAFVLPSAAVSFLSFGVATETLVLPVTATGWAVVLAIALAATVVPVMTFFGAIDRIGASRTSILSTAEPGITVALGALVLDETITAITVVGGALVVTGVVLIQREDA